MWFDKWVVFKMLLPRMLTCVAVVAILVTATCVAWRP